MRRIPLPKGINADITMIFVIVMILTLVLLAALLYPQYNIFTRIATKTPYDICRQSVEQASFMRLGNIELHPYLKCETEQITIKEKNEEKAKKKIADALYNCYYQFGRGEKELFKDQGTFCFVCSTIDFEDEAKQISTLPEFNKYLFENYANTKETYAKYLYKEQTEKTREQLKQKGEYTKSFATRKYGIILLYDRLLTKEAQKTVSELYATSRTGYMLQSAGSQFLLPSTLVSLGALGGAYAIFTFGDYTNIATVTLKPYSAEELNKLGCTEEIRQKSTGSVPKVV
ncbi:hypothetical protein HY484_01680 [Candidatus Woesearchaeota archaeon]|nr:hypothetical protein [Candidatus Woesearchaeota archaeon]